VVKDGETTSVNEPDPGFTKVTIPEDFLSKVNQYKFIANVRS